MMIDKIKLRLPKSHEWVAIQKINHQVFLADKKNDSDLMLDWPFKGLGVSYYKKLASGQYGHCIVAEIEDQIIGYVALAKKRFHFRKSPHIEIENIGVDSQYRNRGVGTELMIAAQDWAREQGIEKIYVEANFYNQLARNFYNKFNFKPIDVIMRKEV